MTFSNKIVKTEKTKQRFKNDVKQTRSQGNKLSKQAIKQARKNKNLSFELCNKIEVY
tara:strand:+ start:3623 stop:3793 length:171 start_codon:yes stop_codon:yes gene_type:complete